MIRDARSSDAEACINVLALLPTHFTPAAHDELRRSFEDDWIVVATNRADEIEGFVVVERRRQRCAEITYAAVRPDRQRSGIGTRLLHAVVEQLVLDGLALIEVKTLDESSGYEPYVPTRRFWERLGFIQVDCIDPLPGWDPGNPSAIYVKALTTT